jgi:inhibitor of cysteine peptidase
MLEGPVMLRVCALTAVLLLTPLVVSTVGGQENPTRPAEAVAREYADPGAPISVKAGEDFVISLDSNRTTGYQWQLAEPLDKNILKLAGIEYKAPKTDLIGAGGKDLVTLKAVGKGKAQVNLRYVRPWEKDAAPAKKVTFSVEVQ